MTSVSCASEGGGSARSATPRVRGRRERREKSAKGSSIAEQLPRSTAMDHRASREALRRQIERGKNGGGEDEGVGFRFQIWGFRVSGTACSGQHLLM
ncbi:hypothetical protein BHM03_00053353 [Ensete ventricosum]|nr:hypothetical protein BHM03_00053353 [Ensete ventricosum]